MNYRRPEYVNSEEAVPLGAVILRTLNEYIHAAVYKPHKEMHKYIQTGYCGKYEILYIYLFIIYKYLLVFGAYYSYFPIRKI